MTVDIVQSLGLTLADLMPIRPQGVACTSGRAATQRFATADHAVAALKWHIDTAWDYHDAEGQHVGTVVRRNRPDGTKEIRPVSRRGDGWIIGAMPDPRPLYRLPELLATAQSNRVFVCEGEKCADALRSLGLVATTSSGGARAAAKSDWSPLVGRAVVVLPDNDAPGREYTSKVAGILSALSPPAKVKIVELGGLSEGGDIVDWLDQRDAQEPQDLALAINALADAAAGWQAPSDECGPIIVWAADVEPRDVQWLWPGRVPLGRISLLVGRPGEGKSVLTCDMAARISTGTPWPDGSDCPQGSTLMVSGEDDWADTIRPRLDMAGANCHKVAFIKMVRRLDDKGKTYDMPFTLSDVDALETALEQVPDCKLVVVDPIGSFLGGGTDSHRDNEVRAVLAPVAALAEKSGATVFIVAHRRKSAGVFADDLALGSRAFVGIARAVWHLSSDPHNKQRRLLLPGKCNLSAEPMGLAFSMEGLSIPRISWESQPLALSADEHLALENSQHKPGPDAEDRQVAQEFLRTALAGGPRPSKDIVAEAREAQGITQKTLKRARKALGVEAYQPEIPGPWWLRLPGTPEVPDPKLQEPGPLGPLGKNPRKMHEDITPEAQGATLPEPGPLGPLGKNPGKTRENITPVAQGARLPEFGPLGTAGTFDSLEWI